MRTAAQKVRHRENERARIAALRAAGRCSRCKEPSLNVVCQGCYGKRKKFMLEYQRERRAKLKSLGMCRDCTREKVIGGLLYCHGCRDKHTVRARNWWNKKRERESFEWQPEWTAPVRIWKEVQPDRDTERIEKMMRLAARAGERLYA